MKLSDKLIALRKENSWSQEDFAEKLDVSRQAISRWENGSALPDAQNILQISKLFHVTADYLLNDDYEDGVFVSNMEADAEETKSSVRKKKFHYRYLVAVICFVIVLSVVAITDALKGGNEVHTHPVLNRVIENKVTATCKVEGSYDEVLYCAECGKEVLRTHIITERPAHQFENQKCTVCGEDQRAKG